MNHENMNNSNFSKKPKTFSNLRYINSKLKQENIFLKDLVKFLQQEILNLEIEENKLRNDLYIEKTLKIEELKSLQSFFTS